jgi:hypothetical protein
VKTVKEPKLKQYSCTVLMHKNKYHGNTNEEYSQTFRITISELTYFQSKESSSLTEIIN